MDPLTGVLNSISLHSAVFCRAKLRAPWAVHTGGMDAGIFHAVVRGRAWITPDGEQTPQALATGDVAMLPHGCGHVMADDPGTTPRPIHELVEAANAEGMASLNVDGGGAETSLVCGRIDFERGDIHPLLGPLPDLIIVRAEDPAVGSWLAPTVQLMAAELDAESPGSRTVITRLADVVVVQALRALTASLPPNQSGWLEALRQPAIARALALIHDRPSERWTVDALAREVGMSRSGFFARFSELVGEPPARYLARWRMHLAARALRRDGASVAEAAERVGYRSVASFSKAFRDLVGISPGAYRRAG
jgi:AraC-like DNA-binding protein